VLRRHPAAAAALIYALLSLLMFAPGLLPGRTLSASDFLWTASPWQSSVPEGVPGPFGSNREQADSVQVFQPFLEKTRERLPDIPLWNPYVMAGRPYLANSQSAVFSPFNVPGYVLPLWRSLGFIAALKIFVAAFGMFLLARALAMRFGGALLAGLVFGFSMWMVTWVSWPTVSVWAFLPWICLMAEHLLRRPGPLPFAGLAGFVALQYFGGHPESCFHTLLMAVLYWAVRVVALRPAGWRAWGLQAAAFFGALAAGTLLAAITLLPFLELVGRSVDSDVRSFLGASHGARRYLFGLFVHDYWGRQTRTPIEFPSAMEENAYYVGALTLMLGLAALLLRPRAWQRIAFAGIGVLALAVATGIPPFFDLVTKLPGFSTAHNSRLAVIFVFCMALLAGWGLDELTEGGIGAAGRRRLLVGACAGLVALPLVVMAAKGTLAPGRFTDAFKVAWLFENPPSFVPAALGGNADLANLNVAGPPEALKEVVRLASLLEWLVLAALAFALIAWRVWGRLGAVAFVALALVLVAGDLFKAGMGYNPGIPIDHAEQPTTGAIRYLQSQLPGRFVGLDATNTEARLPPLPPDVTMRYDLYDARGYDYPIERRYDRFWKENVAGKPGCLYAFCPQTAGATDKSLRALGLLGVGSLLQDVRDKPLRVKGARLAYDGADARVYTNPHALPRAFLVGAQAVQPDDEQAYAAVTSPDFEPRAVAVTHEPAAGVGTAPSSAPAGSADISTYEDERVVVQARAARPSLLVLTDSWAPGWKAKVDGRDADVQRVDYLIRGVAVPAGSHTVELSYEPAVWTWGWVISLVTLIALAAAALIGWRRRA
jgi:hypothetical protein